MATDRLLRTAAAALFALAFTSPAAADNAALDDDDRAAIARAEAYLNSVTTLQARFVQLDASGEAATGRLQVKRPGRMRFDYDPPTPILLVSRGTELVYYDRDLKTATRLDWEDTPAWFLLADRVSLAPGGPYRVVDVHRAPGVLVFTAVDADAPEDGRIVVSFADRAGTLKLAGWVAVDALGQPTRVTLFNLAANQPVDDKAFVFDEPVGALERQDP
ncbi:MAG: outer-membrane lipoprotein carrier protein LolA [Alphaproteobacteria bacterium]|nr:outer-membrane lipoprotein carrier protein LolA [Alphaproteobacteria bacterium]MYE59216.1 outer membrane lipoprotein carrier protein LolA [Alphaproteobacteria bacterium]